MTGSKDNRIPALKKTMLVSLPMALLLLAGCRGGQSEIRTVSETMRIMQAAEQPAAPMPTAEPSPVPACETCAFSDGLDRFIDCYNSCCTALGNTNLLKDRSYWQFYGDCWHYRQFEDNWLEPEFQVFTEPSGALREIRIGFENHGYTEWGEALSEERAFYTLRCLCEEQSDGELRELLFDVTAGMKASPNYVGVGETPPVSDPVACGDYLVYHFFSGGVFQLCVISG